VVKVRVRNFQSIKDASLKIEGLTVVTGANNSGKTSLMRAIRGVFENSPYGSLLRKGEDKITVDIAFEDGKTVTWYKGPKDNAYEINGYKIAGVGRGAPEELKDLGVFPIVASNNTVWPQVANQFDGTIFLLNRSGSVLAEALSDVEKVGKLTSALRLSEKDRRTVNSELKVRRKDLKEQEEKVSRFEGFETLEEQVENLSEQKKTLSEQVIRHSKVKGLYERLKGCEKAVKTFEGFNPNLAPEKEKLLRLDKATKLVKRLDTSYTKASFLYAQYSSFRLFELPLKEEITKYQGSILKVKSFKRSLETKQEKLLKYKTFEIPELHKETEILSQKSRFERSSSYLQRLSRGVEGLREFSQQKENLITKQEKVLSLVSELLGNMGECPVCRTPHGGHCD